MKNKRTGKMVIAGALGLIAAAAFVWVIEASKVPAYASNVGPGQENVTVTVTETETAANNPAYNNGWTSNVGPGATGTNPQGGISTEQESAYAEGPGSETAKQYADLQANTIYIHSTYQGGTWKQREDGKWVLYQSDGQPVSSKWAYVDGKTYLLDMYGAMQTGWQNVNENWYYFNSRGAMQTGWLLKNGKYYFLNIDGSMAYGWVNTQGSWYYFSKPNGDMLTNAYAPDGRYVNAEGVLVQ